MRYAALLLLFVGCVGPNHSVQDLLTPDEFHLFYTDGGGTSSGYIQGMNDPWRTSTGGDTDYTAWVVGLTWNLTGPGPGANAMREAARAMQISARLMAEAATASRSAPEPIVIVQAPEAVPAPVAPQEPVRIVVEAATPIAVAPVVIEVGEGTQGPIELRLSAILEAALLAWASRPVPTPVVVPAPVGEPSEPVVVVPPGAAPDITITVENVASNVVEQDDPEPAGGSDSNEPQGVLLLGISSKVWTQLLIAVGVLATAFATYLGREKIPGVKRLTKKGKAARAEKKADG